MNRVVLPLPLTLKTGGLLSLSKASVIGSAAAIILTASLMTLSPAHEDEITPANAALAPAQGDTAASVMPTATMTPATPASTSAHVSVKELRLQGVLGGGRGGGSAILLLPDGQERLVRTGREFLPGLTLKQIGVSHAVIGRSDGDVRIELGRSGEEMAISAAPAQASTAPVQRGVGEASLARETLAYRLGLQPVRSGGRTKGFLMKDGVDLPQLERAGLRPGDVILAVNGSVLDEERMTELAWTISNSDQTEFEFVREGQRRRASMK